MSGSKCLSINEFSTLVMSKSLIEVNDYVYLSTINLSYIQDLLPTFDLSHIFLSERQNFESVQRTLLAYVNSSVKYLKISSK